MPGKVNFSTAARLELEAARPRALEVEAHVRQTEVPSSQVDQGAIQADQRARQVDQSARQVEYNPIQVENNAGCPSLARRRGAACLAELQRSEAARPAAQRPFCPLAFCEAPA